MRRRDVVAALLRPTGAAIQTIEPAVNETAWLSRCCRWVAAGLPLLDAVAAGSHRNQTGHRTTIYG